MTDTQQEIHKLKDLISSSGRILITSHISPDPDAISSLILLGTILRTNYPDKEVLMAIEEEPLNLDFVSGYSEVKFTDVYQTLSSAKPDLFILLDGNNYDRCSRHEGENIRKYVRENSVKTVVIDHHEPAGKDTTDLYINQGSPATVQDIYEIFLKRLNLKKPKGYAQAAMLGLYGDTGGFAYLNERHSETFAMADELVGAGANIEEIKNLLEQYSDEDMQVFSELAANIRHEDDYSYSFIKDEFVENWLNSGKTAAQLHAGTDTFVNYYIRNIGGRQWGFIAYRNVLQGENIYSASFRSVGETKDVSLIAGKLGGGGHKPAAGAKFEAQSIEDALQKIKQVISET